MLLFCTAAANKTKFPDKTEFELVKQTEKGKRGKKDRGKKRWKNLDANLQHTTHWLKLARQANKQIKISLFVREVRHVLIN